MVRLGDPDWWPRAETSRRFESGPPPVDREMFTLREPAASSKRDPVLAFRIATPSAAE